MALGLVAAGIGIRLLGSPGTRSTDEPAAIRTESDARVTLAADGELTLAIRGSGDRVLGSLETVDEEVSRATLERLRARLAPWAAAGRRYAEERSDLVLGVAAAPTTPWVHVLWLVEVASAPSIHIHRLRFELIGASTSFVPMDLDANEQDADTLRDDEPVEVLGVRLEIEGSTVSPSAPLSTRVTMARTFGLADDDPRLQLWCDPPRRRTSWATYEGVRALIRESRDSGPAVANAVLDIARPQRPRMSYREVFTVLRALRDEGLASARFHHRSTALPGDR